MYRFMMAFKTKAVQHRSGLMRWKYETFSPSMRVELYVDGLFQRCDEDEQQ